MENNEKNTAPNAAKTIRRNPKRRFSLEESMMKKEQRNF